MASGKRTVRQHVPNRIGKFQKAKAVCNMASALADDFTEVVLGVAMFGDQLLIAHRFFKRIEIGTLDVFDDSQLQSRAVVYIPNDDRNVRKTGQLCRAPAPFTSDYLVTVDANRSHDHRLNNPVLTNGRGKILQLIFVKVSTWVSLAASDELDRDGAIRTNGALRFTHRHRLIHFADQRRKTASESTLGKIITHKILLHIVRQNVRPPCADALSGSLRKPIANKPGCQRISDHKELPVYHKTALRKPEHCAE
ncbi:hypothetical protein D3C87_1421820 [compost metagenome]